MCWDMSGQWQIAAIGVAVLVGLVGHSMAFGVCTSILALVMVTVGGATTIVENARGPIARAAISASIPCSDDTASAAAQVWRMVPRSTGMMLTAKGSASCTPTTYYSPQSGDRPCPDARTGELFGDAARVGIVGLGTGTLACYRQPGQAWDFYEIDQSDGRHRARPAANSLFVPQCTPDARMLVGDARIELGTADRRAL